MKDKRTYNKLKEHGEDMTHDKGTWFGWDIAKVGPVSDTSVYGMSKDFADKIGKGEIEVKHETDAVTQDNSKSPY